MGSRRHCVYVCVSAHVLTGSAAVMTGRGAGNSTGHHAHQGIEGAAADRHRARTHLAPATAGGSALASAGGRGVGGAGSAEAGAERQGELEDNNEPRAGGGQAGGCVRVGEGGGERGMGTGVDRVGRRVLWQTPSRCAA